MGNSLRPTPRHVLLQTHWDREWYVPFRVYQLRLLAVLEQLLGLLDSGALTRFSLDGQTVLLEDAMALAPELEERLQPFFESGALHAGPWYTMPDTVLVSFEALVHNLKRGMAQARQWGSTEFTGYLPDSFGHPASLPTLLQGVGLSHAVVWRGRGAQGRSPWFDWQAPDGSQVRVYQLPEGYFQTPLHPQEPQENSPEAMRQALDQLEQTLWQASVDAGVTIPPLIPLGGDHLGPPTAEALQLLADWLGDAGTVDHPHTFMQRYASTMEAVPLHQGELREWGDGVPFLLAGTLSARLPLKQQNAQAERLLSCWVEPLLALAAQAGWPWPPAADAAVEEAWKLVLQNQAHDGICGCSVDAVHRHNQVRYEQALAIGQTLQTHLLQRARQSNDQAVVLAKGIGAVAASAEALVVLPFTAQLPPEEPLQDHPALQIVQTQSVLDDAWQTDPRRIPLSHLKERQLSGWVAVSHAGLQQVAPLLAASTHVDPFVATHYPTPVWANAETQTLGNGCLVVQLLPDGSLTVEVHNGAAPEKLSFTQQHVGWLLVDKGDSYNRQPVPNVPPERWELVHCRWLAKGPLVAEVEASYRFPTRPHPTDWVKCRFRLLANSPRLEVDWQWTVPLPNRLVQVTFTQPTPVTGLAFESHLGLEYRQQPTRASRWEGIPVAKGPHEWQPNGDYHHGILQTPGGWLLTDGLPDYELPEAQQVALTLHRGFGVLSHGAMATRGAPAGPPFETPEAQAIGQTVMARYGWLPPGLNEATVLQERALFLRRAVMEVQGVLNFSHQDVVSLWQGQNPWTAWPEPPDCLSYRFVEVAGTAGTAIRLLNRQPTQSLTLCVTQAGHRLSLLDEPLAAFQPNHTIHLPPKGVVTLWFPCSG